MSSLLQLAGLASKDHIEAFIPYGKQRDAVSASAHCPITWISSCNGAGKTALGAAVNVWHWTGKYPDWYDGIRFHEGGQEYWALAPSATLLKNAIQEQLFMAGTFEEIYEEWLDQSRGWFGTTVDKGGKLAKRDILAMDKAAHYSAKEAYVATIKVAHKSGKPNVVKFYHYELGVKKLAGKHKLPFIFCDEVPPQPIFTELKARQGTNAHGISMMIAATPERYADQEMLAEAFSEEWEKNGNAMVIIDIKDVPDHVIPNKAQKIANTSPKDAPAKLHGLPVSGAIFFETQPEEFRISRGEWVNLQRHNTYRIMSGIDFGFNDPTAMVDLYLNPADKTVILANSLKKRYMNANNFAVAARAAGFDIGYNPCAWPHDGERRDKDFTTTKVGKEQKKTVAQFYRDAGFRMMPEKTARPVVEANKHAVWSEIEAAAQAGLFYVVSGNNDFEQEWRGLQIGENGKVTGNDHIMDALAVAWQSRQFARAPKREAAAKVFTPPVNRSDPGISSHMYR